MENVTRIPTATCITCGNDAVYACGACRKETYCSDDCAILAWDEWHGQQRENDVEVEVGALGDKIKGKLFKGAAKVIGKVQGTSMDKKATLKEHEIETTNKFANDLSAMGFMIKRETVKYEIETKLREQIIKTIKTWNDTATKTHGMQFKLIKAVDAFLRDYETHYVRDNITDRNAYNRDRLQGYINHLIGKNPFPEFAADGIFHRNANLLTTTSNTTASSRASLWE